MLLLTTILLLLGCCHDHQRKTTTSSTVTTVTHRKSTGFPKLGSSEKASLPCSSSSLQISLERRHQHTISQTSKERRACLNKCVRPTLIVTRFFARSHTSRQNLRLTSLAVGPVHCVCMRCELEDLCLICIYEINIFFISLALFQVARATT